MVSNLCFWFLSRCLDHFQISHWCQQAWWATASAAAYAYEKILDFSAYAIATTVAAAYTVGLWAAKVWTKVWHFFTKTAVKAFEVADIVLATLSRWVTTLAGLVAEGARWVNGLIPWESLKAVARKTGECLRRAWHGLVCLVRVCVWNHNANVNARMQIRIQVLRKDVKAYQRNYHTS